VMRALRASFVAFEAGVFPNGTFAIHQIQVTVIV
jgi:hypothetical protein